MCLSPPSPLGRKTAFLGSANAVPQFLFKLGKGEGASTQTARYDALISALALDIEVRLREEYSIKRTAKIAFSTGSPLGHPLTKWDGG